MMELEHIYGGEESALPQELQLVKVWRPMPFGPPQLAKGVIHRVHPEDRTLTVQFVPDQHRVRVPYSSVQPILNIEPVYPKVYLKEGERPPTRSELMAKFMREQELKAMGLPVPQEPERPGFQEGGERRTEKAHQWGIPATTLDALRNRAIPSYQITGLYGKHFYSNLYENNFYFGGKDEKNGLSDDSLPGMGSGVAEVDRFGHVNAMEAVSGAQFAITRHRYKPLNGPEMEQMPDGSWKPVGAPHEEWDVPENESKSKWTNLTSLLGGF